MPDSEYDFIVVGGGSAGCALASRLSEDPNINVLLVEAGGDGLQLDARIPAAAGNLQHGSSDWEEYAEPQPGRACLELIDGRSFWPRGKCLGGSSVLNYMAYVRGNPEDYNSWSRILSDPKWSWDSVKKIFQRMENCQKISGLDPNVRGMNGPLSVTVKQPINPLAKLFVSAAVSLGYRVGDYNSDNQEYVSLLQTTTKNGRRHSSADAYIWPIIESRNNLHVLLDTHVNRVLFETSSSSLSTTGIEIISPKGIPHVIRCRSEVILSASAIGSPKILLQSGIGPKDELQELQIPCLLDHPSVGKNLQDHITVGVIINANPSNSPSPKDVGTINKAKAENFPNGLWSLLEWVFWGTGHLASSTYDTCLFLKTGLNPELPYPDIQLGMLTGLFPRKFWVSNARLDPDGKIPPSLMEDNAQGCILLSILLHPFSRGSISLRSSSYSDKPIIHPNYLLDERDLNTLATGAVELVKVAHQMGYTSENIVQTPSRFPKGVLDLDAWKEQCRQTCSTLYHPSSTCAMGEVVDSDLRVKGITGLRVADASVFPHLTSGNTNAPAIMVGEMAAMIIQKQYGLVKENRP